MPPKSGNKTAATKPAATKPAKKAVQPKKQAPKEATKKVTKPAPVTTPKQKNEKRKREENESTSVHDVDKKMKVTPGSVVVATGKRIIYSNVPETAKVSDFEALFAGLPVMPSIKILSYYNKERVGDVYAYFTDEESYNQATTLTNLSIDGQEIIVSVDNALDEERTAFVARFPGTCDKSDIVQFFDGCQISKIQYHTVSGRVQHSFFVEFADIESKQTALEKSNTDFKDKKVIVYPYEPNKPKSVRKPRKPRAPAKKTAKKTAPQKVPATTNPNQNKTAAKKSNETKAAPAKKPNQKKAGQKTNPNQKNQEKKTTKPAAQKKGTNGTAKAQKKN